MAVGVSGRPGVNGSNPIGGGLCAADGSCAPVDIDPVSICCQVNGSCYDGIESSTSGL